MDIAFHPSLLSVQGGSAVPYVSVLKRLPEYFRKKIVEAHIAPKVIKVLVIKRPPEAEKREFFLQAEAFAALIQHSCFPPEKAALTFSTLLKKPENRAAALTMLAKTLELALGQMEKSCDRALLAELVALVDDIGKLPVSATTR